MLGLEWGEVLGVMGLVALAGQITNPTADAVAPDIHSGWTEA